MTRSGDEFEQVAMPHARSLLRFAQRLTLNTATAEDLVQETLLSAWRNFHQLERGTNARAWLFRILIHAHYGQNRRAQSRVRTVELAAAAHRAEGNAELLEVRQALDRLGEDHRTVLLLAVLEGFTCKEISAILAVPMGTVMSRLSRAREAMRESLAPGNGRQGERAVK